MSEEEEEEVVSEESGVYVPPELICEIFKFLSHSGVCHGMLVCKDFYKALQIDFLWKKLSFYRWTFCRLKQGFKDWKDYYVRTHTVGKRWERGRPNCDYKVQALRRGKDDKKFTTYIKNCLFKKQYLLLFSNNNELMLWKEREDNYEYECLHSGQFDEIKNCHVCHDNGKELKTYKYAISYNRGSDNESDHDYLADDYHLKNIVEVRDENAKVLQTVKGDKLILNIELFDQILVIGRGNESVVVYDLVHRKNIHTLYTNANGTTEMELRMYKPDEKKEYVLFCLGRGGDGGNTTFLKVWKFGEKDQKEMNTIPNIRLFEFNPFLGVILTVNNNNQIQGLKIGVNQAKYTIANTDHIMCIKASGRRKFAVGYRSGLIRMYSCTDTTFRQLWGNTFHKQAINSIVFDHSKLCAASADNCISIHDVKSKGEKLYVLLGGSKRLREGEPTHPTKEWIYEMEMNKVSVVGCIKNLCRVYSFE